MISRGHYSEGDTLIAAGWTLQRKGSTIDIDNKIPLAVQGPIDHVVRAEASSTCVTLGIRIYFLLQEAL